VRSTSLAVAVAMGTGLLGCVNRPFVRLDPPVERAGVAVALLGQRCGRRVRRDQNGILDLILAARVTNDRDEPVTVTPARLALIVRGEPTPPEGHGPPFNVRPHHAFDLQVHYQAWGNARCDEPLALAPAGAIETAEGPLGLPPVSFVPESFDR
jgi:hypothetical protein